MRKGFTLIELMIVIAIIAVIAAIAIPNLMRNKMEANHTAAAASCRQILSAQSTFHKGDYDGNLIYDYCADYSDLYYTQKAGQPIKLIDKALADADDDGGAGIPKSGYLFGDLTTDAAGNAYDNRYECAICAWPALYNRSGLYTYVIDITGSVYMSDLGAGAPLTQYPDTATWLLVH